MYTSVMYAHPVVWQLLQPVELQPKRGVASKQRHIQDRNMNVGSPPAAHTLQVSCSNLKYHIYEQGTGLTQAMSSDFSRSAWSYQSTACCRTMTFGQETTVYLQGTMATPAPETRLSADAPTTWYTQGIGMWSHFGFESVWSPLPFASELCLFLTMFTSKAHETLGQSR
jgi:hypothetical protein